MHAPVHYECLQHKTRALLDELTGTAPFLKSYSLVGGSALALYLCHRKSEDLDFFTYADTFDKRQILDYCKRWDALEMLHESDDQLDLLANGVKLTFFNARWSFLQPQTPQPLNIASLHALAAMKTHVLFMRAKYRDYYDLFFLADKGMSLRELYDCAGQVVPGLTFKLFCIALTYIDDIDDDNIDHLDPVKSMSKAEIRAFFEKQVRNLK